MLKMNEGPSEYPSMDPIYNNNSNNNNEYNNTGNPFMYNRNL